MGRRSLESPGGITRGSRSMRAGGGAGFSMSTCCAATGVATSRARANATAYLTISLYHATEGHQPAHVFERVEAEHHALQPLDRGSPEGTGGVVAELLHHGLRRERAPGPTAPVRLASLHHPPVAQFHAHPPGEAIREGGPGIERVADAGGEPQERRIVQARGGIRVERDAAVEERGGHRVRQAELRVVRRARAELRLTRLADDRDLTRRHAALDRLDLVRVESVVAPERERAVQVGVVVVTARVRLEADPQRLPFLAERAEGGRIGLGAEKRAVEAEAALEDRRGAAEAAAREPRGDDARDRKSVV